MEPSRGVAARRVRRVGLAGRVAIRKDDDLRDGRCLRLVGELVAPGLCATRRRRRPESEAHKRVGAALALDVEEAGRLGELGQAVENAPHAAHAPRPATAAVRPTTPKGLRLEANNLVEEHAPLVGVVVGRNNPRAFSRSPVALVQEIGDGPPDAGRNLLARTAGVALDHERDITIRE